VRLGDVAGALETQNRGVELALLLTLPAAAALIVLATPILLVLFARGAFGPQEAEATAAALAAYAAGLPAFVLVKVLAPGFFAHQNTRTPVKIAIAAMVANLALTIGLMSFLAHVGVALALTLSGWMQALTLLVLLRRHGHFRLDRRARDRIPRIAAAALGMAGIVLGLRLLLEPALAGHAATRLGALMLLISIGVLAFGVLVLALGGADWRELRGRLHRQPA
jgi:putative peptidoglycan lipid II flippase